MSEEYHRIVETIRESLAEQKISQDAVTEAALTIAMAICHEFGARRVYIPRRVPWTDRHARDRAIRNRFNGRNLDQICEEFGVSRRTVYRATKKMPFLPSLAQK